MPDRELRVLIRAGLGLVLAGLLGGCRTELSVSRLAAETLTLSVVGVRPDGAVLEITTPPGCREVPPQLEATVNDAPVGERAWQGPAACEALRFRFSIDGLDSAPGAVNRFELSDATGRVVVEVVGLARPHAFVSVNDPGAPFPGRPFFLLHRGGLSVSRLRAHWVRDGARLADAKAVVRGASVELTPPPTGRPTHLSLEWEEPITVTRCLGVSACRVGASRQQLLELR